MSSMTTVNKAKKSDSWRFHIQMLHARSKGENDYPFSITPHYSWTLDDFWDFTDCIKRGYLVTDIQNFTNVFVINEYFEEDDGERTWYEKTFNQS